jgi:hypothetical protein
MKKFIRALLSRIFQIPDMPVNINRTEGIFIPEQSHLSLLIYSEKCKRLGVTLRVGL